VATFGVAVALVTGETDGAAVAGAVVAGDDTVDGPSDPQALTSRTTIAARRTAGLRTTPT
jgi:hypothetical protein